MDFKAALDRGLWVQDLAACGTCKRGVQSFTIHPTPIWPQFNNLERLPALHVLRHIPTIRTPINWPRPRVPDLRALMVTTERLPTVVD